MTLLQSNQVMPADTRNVPMWPTASPLIALTAKKMAPMMARIRMSFSVDAGSVIVNGS